MVSYILSGIAARHLLFRLAPAAFRVNRLGALLMRRGLFFWAHVVRALLPVGAELDLDDLRREMAQAVKEMARGFKMTVELRGAEDAQRKLSSFQKASQKALSTALRVEGYRLRGIMAKEIRSGAPGGHRLKALSTIARITRPREGNTPLRRLAGLVRYNQVSPDEVRVGFTGPKLSSSWQRLALRHTEGFEGQMLPRKRAQIVRTAARMKSKRGIGEGARHLFLRKDTTTFKTPARPIVEPFWSKHRETARRNIIDNFRRKMAGERI